MSIKKCHPYVEGYRFIVITDHASEVAYHTEGSSWSSGGGVSNCNTTHLHRKGRDIEVPDTVLVQNV